MRATRLLIGALGLVAACSSAAADHQALGDRAYLRSDYGTALVEYRLALRQQTASPELRAKAGAAALRAGDLGAAVEEYAALGKDKAQQAEAAVGLERVARIAVDSNDHATLWSALDALRQIAPDRIIGGVGEELALALGDSAAPRAALTLLPYAAAAAPDARRQDSLMYLYGVALVRAGRCGQAVPVFESLLRRQRDPAVQGDAARGAASCALTLGRNSLNSGQPSDAADWFRRAATEAPDTPEGRAAYVGLGDVMFAQGDFAGAADAYQRAMAGAAPGDSIAQIAAEHLNRLAQPGTPNP
ncbi:MAG TPA: tetratricopeptide repeat protein [Gemmatimonadales bacterium]|nr:tetratricopeptide repeat protein [Gemmatimonadales bacterium]